MHQPGLRKRSRSALASWWRAIAAGLVVGCAPSTAALAAGPRPAIDLGRELAPHRAVYDVTLHESRAGSRVRDVSGRMVYELAGSLCKGWRQSMRFVTRMSQSEGAEVLTDLRSNTFEDAVGRIFRFDNTMLQDSKTAELTAGDAERKGDERSDGKGAVAVVLRQPAARTVALDGEVLFPMQHTLALLAAAKGGKSLLRADVFDGADKGAKVHTTTAVIGKRHGDGKKFALPAAKGSEALDRVPAWPVSIGYFERDKLGDDGGPAYELAFLAYANGVSRRLLIDYGEFAVRGTMVQLTMLEPERCDGPKK